MTSQGLKDLLQAKADCWESDETPINSCDQCQKPFRYDWRRRRTREKFCTSCLKISKDKIKQAKFTKGMLGGNRDKSDIFEIRTSPWDTPLSLFQFLDDTDRSSPAETNWEIKKTLPYQLLNEMKMEFAEEITNPEKEPKMDFKWPPTDQLNKIECLRAFNNMKQLLLEELLKCEELMQTEGHTMARKKYLERRFLSLEKEKIKRLKIYEAYQLHQDRTAQSEHTS